MAGSFTAPGSNVPARVTFNSGTIDFGSNRLVDVDNIKIDAKWTSVPMYVLNSIKMAALARSSYVVTITADLMSWSPEIDGLLYGSSVAGTPAEITSLDGQPTLQNPVITCFDSNNKEFQYQVINAIFTADSTSLTQEVYAKWSINLTAIDINIVYTE